MPYITAAVIAGTAIYGAIDASSRRSKAKKALEQLKKNQPKFRDAASIQAEAEGLIKQGYSPEEAANFQGQLTRGQNQAYRLSTDRNPNLAPAIGAGINYARVGAMNEFASNDAALRRQRVQDYVGLTTGQSNAQTQADINNKRDQEIAYGNAKSQANADIYNSISQLGYAGASAATAGGGGGSGRRVTGAPLSSSSVPSSRAVNGAQPSAGSDQWARNLYGNPNPAKPQPYMGTTQFGGGIVNYPTVGSNQWGQNLYGAPIFSNKTTVPFYQQPQ